MKLNFPTSSILPKYPTRPAPPPEDVADEETTHSQQAIFLAAVRNFFNRVFAHTTLTRRYSDAGRFHIDQDHTEAVLRAESQETSHEAIEAVIKNISPRVAKDYVWDAQSQKWVTRTRPL